MERRNSVIVDNRCRYDESWKTLEIFYPNMVHLTCIIDELYRGAEEVRLHFPLVNNVVPSINKVFIIASLWIECYRRVYCGTYYYHLNQF